MSLEKEADKLFAEVVGKKIDIEKLLFEACQEKVFAWLVSKNKMAFRLEDYREAWNACGSVGGGPSDEVAISQIEGSRHIMKSNNMELADVWFIRLSSFNHLVAISGSNC